MNRTQIREIFLRNGFNIKPGCDDLKTYVYAAAEELLNLAEVERLSAVQGEPVAYISHTSEGDILGRERQFDAPSHTALQPVEQQPVSWIRIRGDYVILSRCNWMYPESTEDNAGSRDERRFTAVGGRDGDIVLPAPRGAVDREDLKTMLDWSAALKPAEQPDPTDMQILAITTAYEQGVGKGHDAHHREEEIQNPYGTSWGCDKAWQMGYEEGKEQAAYGAKSSAVKPEPISRRLRAVHAMILNALDRDAADGKAVRGEMAAELRSAISEQQHAPRFQFYDKAKKALAAFERGCGIMNVRNLAPVGRVKTVGGYPDESEHTVEWLCKYKELKDGDLLYTTQQPAEQHPDDAAVDRFAAAMKTKLNKKRQEGRGGGSP